MRNPEYICTEAAKHALQTKIFDTSFDDFANMECDDWITLMNQVITIQNNSNFKFSDQPHQYWTVILQTLPINHINIRH
jgi:hypothetical protein